MPRKEKVNLFKRLGQSYFIFLIKSDQQFCRMITIYLLCYKYFVYTYVQCKNISPEDLF